MLRTADSMENGRARSEANRHISVYGLGRLAAIGSQLVTVVVLSRIDKELYLQYSIATAITLGSSNLFFGWARQALLRNSQSAGPGTWLPQTGLLSSFGACAVVAAAIARITLRNQSWSDVAVVAIVAFTFCVGQYFVTAAQATLQPAVAVTLESGRLALTALLPLAVNAAVGINLQGALVLSAVANLFPVVGMLRGAIGGGQLSTSDLAFGAPIAVWLMVSTALVYSDRWVLAYRVNNDVAAAYAITYDLVAKGASALLLPLVVALHPLIMQAANRDRSGDVKMLMKRALSYQLGMAVPLLIGAACYSMFGDIVVPSGNTQSSTVLLLAFSGVAWQAALILHKPYEISRQSGVMLLALALALGLNVGANWTLAPIGGAPLVAGMNLVSVVVYVGLLPVLASWRRWVRA